MVAPIGSAAAPQRAGALTAGRGAGERAELRIALGRPQGDDVRAVAAERQPARRSEQLSLSGRQFLAPVNQHRIGRDVFRLDARRERPQLHLPP